jgi:tetratricopeptide (TPR) repeat protein
MKKLLFIVLVFVTSYSYSQTKKYFNYFDSGWNKKRLGDYRGAIMDYSKAIQLNPNVKNSAYYSRGFCKENLKDYIGAIADYTKAIQLDSEDSEAYYNRGNSKLMLNQKNSACLDWSKARELGDEDAYEMIKKYCN